MSDTKNADNSFVEGLDTVFQLKNPERDARRVRRLLTGGALYSRNFAFSDTMLIDNLGFRHLFLHNSAFQELISQISVAGIRKGSESLMSVVEKQIKAGMIFSSFPDRLKSKIKSNTPDELTISPDQVFDEMPEYKQYIETLDSALNKTKNKFTASWEMYETVLQRLIDNEKSELADNDTKHILEGLIERTRQYVAGKGRNRIDRSDYHKVVKQGFGLMYPGPAHSQQIVIDFFVDRAYRDNFWMNNNVAMVSHTSKVDSELYKLAFPEREEALRSVDPHSKNIFRLPPIEINTKAILSLDHLDFDFHVELRKDNTVLDYLNAIYEAKDAKDAQALLRDYWLFIDGKLNDYFRVKEKPRLLRNGKKAIDLIAISAEGLALYSALRGYQHLSENMALLLSAQSTAVIATVASVLYDRLEQAGQDKQTKIELDLKKYFRDVKLGSA